MNWKDLKLKGKFSVAFGAIIVLLIFVSFWAVNGIRGIIYDAEEVIDGNKLKTLIVEKEVDHLNWASAVSELLNNDEVSTLDVQVNSHECGFGKWYYSKERELAEELVPELVPILNAIEEPHQHLHESAVEIQEKFVNVDQELSTFLAYKRGDHIQWMNTTRKEILSNKRKLSVQKDPKKCGLGQWLYSAEVQEMAKTDPELRAFINDIETPHNDLHSCAKIIEGHLVRNDRQGAIRQLNTFCEDNANKVLTQIDDIIAVNNSKAESVNLARMVYANKTMVNLKEVQLHLNNLIKTTEENIMTDDVMLHEASRTSSGVIVLSVIIAIFAVIIAIVIAKGIIAPINKGVVFAKRLATGDLTSTIDVNQEDEVGQLASSLNVMAGKLRTIVEDILTGADNIASASIQMSSTSQEMSQGAAEQASSVEEVTSSMEEMSANIEQNTENAQGTEKIAVNSASGIKEGASATNSAVDGMKNIAEKIRIINDIAFQTNILALNAAVEAARAGEHGKGFAVVAAEVRKLAERSKLAADEIDELSKNGVDIAEQAGNKLNEIVPEIAKTANLVQEIASASIEQRTGADQVNNAMQQLNNVTQQNAAASEELATSAEELASQAEHLKDVIQFFKTGNKMVKAKPVQKMKPKTVKLEQNKVVDKKGGNGHALQLDGLETVDADFESF